MEIKRTNDIENYVKYIPWPTYGDVEKLKNELASVKEWTLTCRKGTRKRQRKTEGGKK